MQLIKLNVNDQEFEISVKENWNLLQVLREQLNLKGAKCGCNTGECGSCRVIIDGEAINSCLILARNAQGKKIYTIESLSRNCELHPIQKSFVDTGAVQCGFCTPGMIMSSKALLDSNLYPTKEEIKNALRGNLCRCTGYVKIIEAVELAAKRMRGEEE